MSDLKPILPAGTVRIQVGNRGAWLDPTDVVALEPEMTTYTRTISAVLRSGARVVIEDRIASTEEIKGRVEEIARKLWQPESRVRIENH